MFRRFDMFAKRIMVFLCASVCLLTPAASAATRQQAMFAAGCFWGVDAAFQHLKGVTSTTCGYAGGSVPNPNYQLVCSGGTGHAESVLVEFDPSIVSYKELLDKFWPLEDPTVFHGANGQYRSVIFYFNAEQKKIAEESRNAIQPKYKRPICTQIVPAPKFWRAEEYHQHYDEKHHISGVCAN